MNKLVLETQMRAGSHYFCLALFCAYRPVMYYPLRDGNVRLFNSTDLGVLKDGDGWAIDTRFEVLFRHYYHELHADKIFSSASKIALIAHPFDSFFSDGIVFSASSYSAAPSSARTEYSSYVLRKDSEEWEFLYPYMLKNAAWLKTLSEIPESDKLLLVRYEDIIDDFVGFKSRLVRFIGRDMAGEIPEPRCGRKRIYWAGDDDARFDTPARDEMWSLFGESVDFFYKDWLRRR